MRPTKIYLLILISVAGISTAVHGQNSTAALMQLSRGADIIITGRVVGQASAWNPERTRIFTKTTLQVERTLKGSNKEQTVDVLSPGGEVGDIGEIYTHMPRFREKEEVLLFLKSSPQKNVFMVVEGDAGKFSLQSGNESSNARLSGNSIEEQVRNLLKDQK